MLICSTSCGGGQHGHGRVQVAAARTGSTRRRAPCTGTMHASRGGGRQHKHRDHIAAAGTGTTGSTSRDADGADDGLGSWLELWCMAHGGGGAVVGGR